MKNLSRIQNLIYGQPWAITDVWLNTIESIFRRCVSGEQIDFAALEAKAQESTNGAKSYQVEDGVAIISVVGPIFPRANLFTKISGATSMQSFAGDFTSAMRDDDVHAIVMSFDSPGGAVQRLNETATMIHDATERGVKPVVSFADTLCCSAAYQLASQADEVVVSEGAEVGSIGVIARIDNDDRMLRNAGVDPVVIRSAELKAPGVGPLTPNQMDSLQRSVDRYFGMFKDAVIRGRPSIDIDMVATGETWVGKEAVLIGLADDVGTLDEVVASLK